MSQKGNCPVCGKEVLVSNLRDIRNNVPIFCSRVCATNLKFAKNRYAGGANHEKPTAQELLERKA